MEPNNLLVAGGSLVDCGRGRGALSEGMLRRPLAFAGGGGGDVQFLASWYCFAACMYNSAASSYLPLPKENIPFSFFSAFAIKADARSSAAPAAAILAAGGLY